MGVGVRPNCPDRSWCVATEPGMRSSGDTGRSYLRAEIGESHRRHGGEKAGPGEGRHAADAEQVPALGNQFNLIATRTPPLHSVALRVTMATTKIFSLEYLNCN
jgi:hypothetical protein